MSLSCSHSQSGFVEIPSSLLSQILTCGEVCDNKVEVEVVESERKWSNQTLTVVLESTM